MFNPLKKSLILLGIISSIPIVYAQGDIASVFGETIQLFFTLIGGIFTTILDALKSSPIYGKIFITAFIGIFFYTELKQMDVFKKNVKLAGFVAVLIALIVAFGFPDSVIGLLFSETTPFIGFVIAAFILLVAGNRGNWSHAARGIAFIVLMIAFGSIINLFPTWAQVIIAGLIIASLISAIYSFTRLKASEEGEEKVIEKVVEDHPEASDKDIADYLTKATGEEVKPSDVKAVREGRPIPKKEEGKTTKKSYLKPVVIKEDVLYISHAIKELDREGDLANTAKNKTGYAIFSLDRNYTQAKNLLEELTHLPESESKKIRDITNETISKIFLNTTIYDDYIQDISNLEDGITGNINELDRRFAFVKDKKFYKLTEDGIKRYKADILNLMEIIKKSNNHIKTLQQKILRDANNLSYEHKDYEIEQKELRDRVNKMLMYCEEQLRTIANKSSVYSDIINRSNSLKTELNKLFTPISSIIKSEVNNENSEGFMQGLRRWIGKMIGQEVSGSIIRAGDESKRMSRGQPMD